MSTEPVEDVMDTYRRLLRYTARYWWVLLASFLGYALYSGVQPVIADLMKLVAKVIEHPTPFYVMVICVAPLGVALVQGLGQFIGGYCLAWVGQHVVYELRNDVFHHVLRFPLLEYQRTSSARLMSKIIFDASQVTNAGTDAVAIFLREGLSVVALLGYLLYSNWKLTLILLTVGPVIGIVVTYTSRRFRHISRKMQVSMGSITQYLSEAFDGHQVVKIFAGQAYERERFHKASRRFEKHNVKMRASSIGSTVAVQVVVAIGVGTITYLYIKLMGSHIAMGDFLAFITGVGLIQKPLKQLTNINPKIQRGVTGAASVFELLDRETEDDEGGEPLSRARGELEFRQVSFSYQPGQPVLKSLTFHVKAGQTIALVGRSGAGKSTISSLLPRFYEVTQGTILLDGKPLANYRLSDLRRQIAMVSQKVVLFNDTVRNNIAYGELAGASDAAIEKAARDAFAWDFIQALEKGMETELGDDGMQLSGGQRQRLAIARALLKDAPILILDEATSSLDTESEFHIQQALEHAMENRTTLVIAHRLSTVEKADKILVLDAGQIVEEGTHDELLAKGGAYTQLYSMNFADA
jgi:subfamily B ATP-binding cassette protein MsbA